MTTYNLQQHDGPVPDILEFQMPMCPGGAWPNTACEHAKLQEVYAAYEKVQRAYTRSCLYALQEFQSATAPPNGGPGSPTYVIALENYRTALENATAELAEQTEEIRETYTQGVLEECCGN